MTTMLGRDAPRRWRVVVDISMLAAAIALIMTGWLFYDRITTSREAQADTNAAIRTVLCFAKAQAVNDLTVPPDRRERAVRFYDEALRRIGEPPCTPTIGAPR